MTLNGSFIPIGVIEGRLIRSRPSYCDSRSPVLDNQAFTIDAFSMNWNYLHAYAFPPTMLIPSVLNKICQCQCRIDLIAPLWPQQAWFSEVLQLLVSAPVHLPLVPNLLSQQKESSSSKTSQLSTFTHGSYQTIN